MSCRTTSDKRDLVRVVRTANGVEVDPGGKKPGRGAYVCRNPVCWQQALRKGRLDAALRTALSADEKLKLAEFAASLQTVAV